MYVCICNCVTDSEIQEALETLYNLHKEIDLELLKQYTNTGNSCTRCTNYLKDLLLNFYKTKNIEFIPFKKNFLIK